MKLNYKRTLLVGFAFFLICLFWQAYDSIIPKILTDKFGMSQTMSGFIMALDNILAVFMLPLFGAISDRKNSKLGRRTPFILVGTLIAAVAFFGLSFADNMQLTQIQPIPDVYDATVENNAALEALFDESVTFVDPCDTAVVNTKTTLQALYPDVNTFGAALAAADADATARLTAARQAYARQKTVESPVTLVVFMILLLITLVAMSSFRSPAVALMPDVTPKPLRSKANAIINLMGSFGGILVLGLGIVFGTGKTQNTFMSYTLFFGVCAGIMVLSLVVFLLTVREPKWAKEAQAVNDKLDEKDAVPDTPNMPAAKLSRAEMKSLLFILASVILWFMGYNAVTSKYSVYAGNVLGLDYNLTLIVAQAAAILSYLPVGIISTKCGRKKTIMAGIIMLGAAFGTASFLRAGSNVWVMNAIFALAGIGWATINVNSFPMVVELAKSGDVGKFTGFYYTASMAAQIVTPILSGIFLDTVGMTTLFPYATLFVAAAFITMLFVRHGDAKPVGKADMLEYLDAGDD